jgi:hypothetical protein
MLFTLKNHQDASTTVRGIIDSFYENTKNIPPIEGDGKQVVDLRQFALRKK